MKFRKQRSIKLILHRCQIWCSPQTDAVLRTTYECPGTFLSVSVPSAEVVKNWSDESAFSTADVEERVLSVLRHVGVYMDIVR
jgi:hypothetical protein